MNFYYLRSIILIISILTLLVLLHKIIDLLLNSFKIRFYCRLYISQIRELTIIKSFIRLNCISTHEQILFAISTHDFEKLI
jgi:hypothetical protein